MEYGLQDMLILSGTSVAGGTVAGKVAVLAEKKASERGDIIFLESLPAYSQEKTAVNI